MKADILGYASVESLLGELCEDGRDRVGKIHE